MIIALAQITPTIRKIEKSIEEHIYWIKLAKKQNAKLVVFPELSLTNYDPAFCIKNSINLTDKLFDRFQKLSDRLDISFAIGAPLKSKVGVNISMILFSKESKPFVYNKQFLHKDELQFFVEGDNKQPFPIPSLSAAICYESTIEEHYNKAAQKGSDMYMVSVAKSVVGVKRNRKHLQNIARLHSMNILHVNYAGDCGEFIAGGETSVISKKGKVLAKLPSKEEGLLIYNWDTNFG